MIDTNKLRRLAQAAMHPVTKGRWMRLFGERTVYDRMEDGCRGIPVVSTDKHPPSSFEAACLDFIAAANPAVINELLDRLEAAESDCLEQARLNGMGGEREAALMAKLEAAEKSDAESIAMYRRVRDERDALHAKIEAMEKQKPVATVRINVINGNPSVDFVPGLHYLHHNDKLYLAPGAKGETK